jgi:hypothetical protein
MVENITIDGSTAPIFGDKKTVGYKTEIIIMNGRLVPFFTLKMYGDVVNENN